MSNIADNLLALDPIVILAYLAVTMVIGIFGNRILGVTGKGEDDYFLGGRKMPGWLNGVSQAATSLNSDVAPLYCGIALAVGLSSGWFFLSRFGFGMMLAAMLFAVRWRQLRIKTGPEYFQLRFHSGRKFVRVYTSLSSVLIGIIPWIGAGLLGVHMVMAPIFHFSNISTTLLLVLPLLIIYVWIGGFAGVLLTDLFQSCVILLANLALVVSVLYCFGGPSGLADAVTAANPQEADTLLSVLPDAGNPVLNPMTIFAWMLLTCIGAGGSVNSEGQRLFSCRSDRDAIKVGIWSEIILFAMLLMLMLPTLGLLARYPELHELSPGERETAYGRLLAEFLPQGCLGLAIAAVLASAMSTISTHLSYGAQTLLNDVWRPLRGAPRKGMEVWIGRLFMLAIAGGSVAVVYCSDSLLGIAITVLGLFGATGSFSWGQWWWYRVNFKSWCVAIATGPFLYFGLGWLLPMFEFWRSLVEAGEIQAQNMQILQALLTMVLGTLVWVIVTLCTRPEDMETLKEFYLRARPMGYWRPVRRALIEEGRLPDCPAPRLMLPGVAVAAVGFAMIACGVLALSAFYVGRYGVGGMLAAGALVIGVGFKIMFNRYAVRLSAGSEETVQLTDHRNISR